VIAEFSKNYHGIPGGLAIVHSIRQKKPDPGVEKEDMGLNPYTQQRVMPKKRIQVAS